MTPIKQWMVGLVSGVVLMGVQGCSSGPDDLGTGASESRLAAPAGDTAAVVADEPETCPVCEGDSCEVDAFAAAADAASSETVEAEQCVTAESAAGGLQIQQQGTIGCRKPNPMLEACIGLCKLEYPGPTGLPMRTACYDVCLGLHRLSNGSLCNMLSRVTWRCLASGTPNGRRAGQFLWANCMSMCDPIHCAGPR